MLAVAGLPYPQSGDPMHDLTCVIHVHSTFSDGTATVPELIEATRNAEADALLLTDHDSLEARRRGFEGWHGDVLLLVGVEVSPRRGHYLAFGIDEEVEHAGMSESEIAAAVRAGGGIGFPAHPFSAGSRISRRIAKPHPWTAFEGIDHTGIEVWSLLTDAGESWASFAEAFGFLRRPEQAIVGPSAASLVAWDRLGAARRCVGIAGLDAHQTGIRVGNGRVLSPIPNERFFRILRTHVLCDRPPTGDLGHDSALIYDALGEGRCYIAVDALAPAHGFDFWAERVDARLEMGSESRNGDRLTLRAQAPSQARLRLLRDGREVAATTGGRLDHPVEGPGVWRIEAWRESAGRERAWILSNPIYVRG
jgi:hypothetical protein